MFIKLKTTDQCVGVWCARLTARGLLKLLSANRSTFVFVYGNFLPAPEWLQRAHEKWGTAVVQYIDCPDQQTAQEWHLARTGSRLS